jgi:ribosome biogenesis GTPase
LSDLFSLGFRQSFLSQLEGDALMGVFDPSSSVRPGRVSFVSRDRARALFGAGPAVGVLLPARFCDPADPVLVGDWLVVDVSNDPPLALQRLERDSELRRRDPGGGIQRVAANLDLGLICTAVGADFSVRRAERWMALCHEAGITPVLLLTKADPGRDVSAEVAALERLGAEVVALSALHGTGIPQLAERLAGQTSCMLGSSGVGKSTLLNALLGEEAQDTGGVRDGDDKGRHTTTARSLWRLPGGGLLVDNPGVREVGLIDEDGVGAVFPEVDALLSQCRYRDCQHDGDEGCALDGAVESGELDPDRLAAWRKLQREAAYEARRNDAVLRRAEEKKWRKVHLAAKARNKLLGKGRYGS